MCCVWMMLLWDLEMTTNIRLKTKAKSKEIYLEDRNIRRSLYCFH